MQRDEYQSHISDRESKSSEEIWKESSIKSENKGAIVSLLKTAARLENIVIGMCFNSEKLNNMSDK